MVTVHRVGERQAESPYPGTGRVTPGSLVTRPDSPLTRPGSLVTQRKVSASKEEPGWHGSVSGGVWRGRCDPSPPYR